MKTLGIIAEYNPFHNGHLYHLKRAKQLVGADSVVCVMSGNFIQRGEPAIVDKWARAEMALQCGIDLVLELPVVYAMSSAESFAFGGVKILDCLGIVDFICFGSETGEISVLEKIAEVLSSEPEQYRLALRECLDRGVSYPSARQEALASYFNQMPESSGLDIGSVMTGSNNILGIEYLKALKKLKSRIRAVTVARAGSSYKSETISGSISSATSIRKHIYEHFVAGVCDGIPGEALPIECAGILKREFEYGRGPVSLNSFENIILAYIRKTAAHELRVFPYVSEGLENRIKDAADKAGTLDELIEGICTRRYPRTRIQRILLSMLIGMTSRDFESFNINGGPQYIRVLGFNKKGRQLLSQINETASLPVIVKAANFKKTSSLLLNRMLEIESQATDIYVLGYSNPAYKISGQEYTRNVIIQF